MAKIIFSSLVDSITGKLGGSVFQVTVGGYQIRNRVTPRNPRSATQQRTRSVLAFLIQNWNNLSGAERTSWIDNAPVGSTGISFYAAMNQYISLTPEPFINTYTPTVINTINPVTFSVISTSDLIIGPASDDLIILGSPYLNVFATKQLSPGTSFISPSEYKFLKSIVNADIGGGDIVLTSDYVAAHGALQVNSVIGIRYYIIETTSGVATATEVGQASVS
jgi:hypothetical protein